MTHIGRSEKVLAMKVFLSVLILTFSLQSLTKADDIRELQIEGMSIGDSLLEYFSEKQIIANTKDVYSMKKDKTFVMAAFDTLEGYNFSKYEAVQIEFKKNDKNYIIHGVTGKVFSNYDKDIEACFEHQDKVINELTKAFSNYSVLVIRDQNLSPNEFYESAKR